MSHSRRALKSVQTDRRSLQVLRVVQQNSVIQLLQMVSVASAKVTLMKGQCLELRILLMTKVINITTNLKSFQVEHHNQLTFTSTNRGRSICKNTMNHK